MEAGKKATIGFLWLMNIISLAAGIITELNVLLGRDVTSIIPIRMELTVYQILFVNFLALSLVIMLICFITTLLATDIPYSLGEIIGNCPLVFMLFPSAVLILGIVNGIRTPEMIDKITIIAGSIAYLLMNVINLSCVATVRYDAED